MLQKTLPINQVKAAPLSGTAFSRGLPRALMAGLLFTVPLEAVSQDIVVKLTVKFTISMPDGHKALNAPTLRLFPMPKAPKDKLLKISLFKNWRFEMAPKTYSYLDHPDQKYSEPSWGVRNIAGFHLAFK
jgi:hypothetical protein